MNNKIIIGLLLAVLLVPGVSAGLTWDRSCLNITHLFKSMDIFVAGTEYAINQTVYCQYNCSNITLSCNPNIEDIDYNSAFVNVIVLLAVAAMFLIISFNLKERHPELAFMFLVSPLFMMIAAIYLAGSLFHAATQSPMQNAMFSVMYLVVAAMILTVLVLMFKIIIAALKTFLSPEEGQKELQEL